MVHSSCQFVLQRDWHQYHTPRNILLSLIGEVGELSQILRWKPEVKPGLSELTTEERQHVADEISDVLINVVRFADVAGYDCVFCSRCPLAAHDSLQ